MAPHASTANARELLMVSLSRFYAQRAHMQRVLPYLTSASTVSLRLIDWFVTNYAKKMNVVLSTPGGAHFNVYISYRTQLKAYSKQQFDPFRRRDRIVFFYDHTHSVETTLGQLNFFRWMLQNGILDYVAEHAEAIERDMLASQHDAAACKKAGAESSSDGAPGAGLEVAKTRKKRTELSTCKAASNMTRIVGTRTVSFG